MKINLEIYEKEVTNMLTFIKNLQSAVAVYSNIRNAPDAIAVKKSISFNFSVFRKNKREEPLFNLGVNGREIEMALIDISLILGAVLAVIMVCSVVHAVKHKLMYRRKHR